MEWKSGSPALLAGVLRVALFFYMAIALMAPLGTDPDELFRRGSSVDHSLRIGDITLAPQALLTALAVACAGFLAIRLLKHWLSERFFPHTTLEPGMRTSIVTLPSSSFCTQPVRSRVCAAYRAR